MLLSMNSGGQTLYSIGEIVRRFCMVASPKVTIELSKTWVKNKPYLNEMDIKCLLFKYEVQKAVISVKTREQTFIKNRH